MEVKKIVEGMTAQQVAQVIDDNFKAQNKILEEDIAKQNNVIGVSEYKDFSEAEAVNVGDVRKYNGFLYECVEATTGAFDASKWKKSSFKAETEKKLSELGSKRGIYIPYGITLTEALQDSRLFLYNAIIAIKLIGFEESGIYAPFVIWRNHKGNSSFRIQKYDGTSWENAFVWVGEPTAINPNNEDIISIDLEVDGKRVIATLDFTNIPEGYSNTVYDGSPVFVFSKNVIESTDLKENIGVLKNDISALENEVYDYIAPLSNRGYILYDTGIIEGGGYSTTDYIKVKQGNKIRISGFASGAVAKVAAYDSKREYLKNGSLKGNIEDELAEYVVPIDVEYIRVSLSDGSLNPSCTIINNALSDIDQVINGAIYNNKQLNTLTGFIDKDTGAINNHSDFYCSDFLPILSNKEYKCLFNATGYACVAFYDNDKQYLNLFWQSGGTQEEVFTSPVNAAYVRLSNRHTIVASPYWEEVKDYDSLKSLTSKVKKIEESINDDNTDKSKLQPLTLYPMAKLPCISFNFDDAPIADEQIISLFEKYHLTCGFAICTDSSFRPNIYKGYQDKGFCILNHSVDGKEFTTGNYTYGSALSAIMSAKNGIEAKGMRCNGWVSPSSFMATDFLPILKMAHAYAFTTSTTSATANGRDADRCQLHRYSMESNDLATTKAFIDSCIENDQIITLYGHAANLKDSSNGQGVVFNIAHIESIIQYCIEKRNQGKLFIGNTDDCVKYFFDL